MDLGASAGSDAHDHDNACDVTKMKKCFFMTPDKHTAVPIITAMNVVAM